MIGAAECATRTWRWPPLSRSWLSLVVVSCLLAGTWLGCTPQQARFGPGVVARIDGENLTYADFERFLSRVGEEPTSLESAVMAALFVRFLDEELLHRLAQDRRLLSRSEAASLAAEALLGAVDSTPPSEEAIATHYEEHRGDFERPQRVVLRQMLLSSRELARAALEALRNGLSWQQVAIEIAGDPSGSIATELALDELPEELAPTIIATSAGEVTPILEQQYGFHLFFIEKRLSAGVVPLVDARREIVDRLEQEARERAYETVLGEAWKEYNVEIARTNLPFVVSEDLEPGRRDAEPRA